MEDGVRSGGAHVKPGAAASQEEAAPLPEVPSVQGGPGATGGGKPKRPKRKWDLKSKILLIVGLILLAAAIVMGGFILHGYLDARARYDNATQASGIDASLFDQVVTGAKSLLDIDIDWAALKAINPDVIGWIYIENTDISYPIVQGPDNEYYLTHSIDKEYSSSGAIFLDAECARDFSDGNNIIYGHNMLDGSMFAQILKFKEQDFLNQGSKIIIVTPEYAFLLSPAFTYVCSGAEELRQIHFASQEDLQAYITELMGHAVTESIVDTTKIDKLFSLVTCSYEADDVRTVLCCVQMDAVQFPTE